MLQVEFVIGVSVVGMWVAWCVGIFIRDKGFKLCLLLLGLMMDFVWICCQRGLLSVEVEGLVEGVGFGDEEDQFVFYG